MEKRKRDDKQIVVHSGGGPDESTMGIANTKARKRNFLSCGHPLGVKKEPQGSGLDCVMSFRNEVRDARQGNMAAAGDVIFCTEGGGGTREERGIALTDIAIARDKPFPVALVGVSFYLHEYMQYLRECADGTLDDYVLDCVSLLDKTKVGAHEGADIAMSYYDNPDEVKSCLPERLPEDLQAQVDSTAHAAPYNMTGENITLAAMRERAKELFRESKEVRQASWKHGK